MIILIKSDFGDIPSVILNNSNIHQYINPKDFLNNTYHNIDKIYEDMFEDEQLASLMVDIVNEQNFTKPLVFSITEAINTSPKYDITFIDSILLTSNDIDFLKSIYDDVLEVTYKEQFIYFKMLDIEHKMEATDFLKLLKDDI